MSTSACSSAKEVQEEDSIEEEYVSDSDESEQQRLAIHLEQSRLHETVARKNFLAETTAFKWEGAQGMYRFRAKSWKRDEGFDSLSGKEYEWPQAYVGCENQSVNAAMWFEKPASDETSDGSHVLVAVWTFSSTGDETNLSFQKDYRRDVWKFSEAVEDDDLLSIVCDDEDCAESFSVSSGDSAVKDFYCIPLIEFLIEEGLSQKVGEDTKAVAKTSESKKRLRDNDA
jgi:hypothetical protein